MRFLTDTEKAGPSHPRIACAECGAPIIPQMVSVSAGSQEQAFDVDDKGRCATCCWMDENDPGSEAFDWYPVGDPR